MVISFWFINSSHQSYIISNKKNSTTYLSHWEIAKLRNSQDLDLECIDNNDKNLLVEIVQIVLNKEKWIPFRYPVDFSEYPEYYAAVPYPIYTELIYKRLKNNYYRHNSVIS